MIKRTLHLFLAFVFALAPVARVTAPRAAATALLATAATSPAPVIINSYRVMAAGSAFNAADWGTVEAEYRARDVVGSPVSSWPDHSGNGHDLVQATGGNQPTLVPNVVGSWPGVSFDGTDDYLACGTAGNCGTIVALIGDITHSAANALCRANGIRLLTWFPNSTTIYGGDPNEFWGSSTPTLVDGVSTYAFPAGFAVVVQSGTPTVLGATFNIGNSQINDAFNGKLVHAVFYSNTLSGGNQVGVSGAMRSEYGL